MATNRIQEHEVLPGIFSPGKWNDAFAGKALFKWDFDPKSKRWCYLSYFRIGAEWIDRDKFLVVTPKSKMEEVDWAEMFRRCFETEEGCSDGFGQIYDIDLEAPPISDPTLQSVLTPLLVVHFLSAVKRVVRKGLKTGDISREENLAKVRGRIMLARNLRRNIISGHAHRALCRFSEMSVDIPENRLIKRALLFSERMCRKMAEQGQRGGSVLQSDARRFLSVFSEVGEFVISSEVFNVKRNKLFRAYDDAIRLAKMILRRYENSIDRVDADVHDVPPFWVDMSLLYEHYVLGKLRAAYGHKILYQAKVSTGYPDFLFKDISQPMILDTKYKPQYDDLGKPSTDDIRQLAGYARDRSVLRRLGMTERAVQDTSVVPCVIVYPRTEERLFGASSIDGAKTPKEQPMSESVDGFVDFYFMRMDLPRSSNERRHEGPTSLVE